MIGKLSIRDCAIVATVITASVLAITFTPVFESTFSIGRLAFVFIAMGAIAYTFASSTAQPNWRIKSGAWICLVIGTAISLIPVGHVLGDIQNVFEAWTSTGSSLQKATWETSIAVISAPKPYLLTTLMYAVVRLVTASAIILIPIREIFKPRIGANRRSHHGPWQANWISQSSSDKLAKNKVGLPLALHNGKVLRYKKDESKGWRGGRHLVVAGTRGGKGTSAVIPAILEHQGPIVALDIKGENFATTRRHRARLGRAVAILNPFGVVEEYSDTFNPLDYIRPEHMIRDVDVIADGLVKPEQGEGAHFAELARHLVAAAIEVIVRQAEPGNRNLVAVADLVLSPYLDQTLQAWTEQPNAVGHRPAQTAATILQAGDRERGSIQTSVAKAFAWMQSDEMRRFLQTSSFRMDDLLDDLLDLFIVVPLDQIEKQAVFMRLFVNLVLSTVVRQDGRRKVKAPVLLVLDEFVRMGRMEQIMNIANVAAGAGIEALFVTQDIGQVENAYGRNGAHSIFGSCITKRIFNVNDIATAEWASRHSGEKTIYSQQIREKRLLIEKNDLSYSEQRQKLLTPDQILSLKPDEVLLLIGNQSPLITKQNVYFENKIYNGLYDRNPLI